MAEASIAFRFRKVSSRYLLVAAQLMLTAVMAYAQATSATDGSTPTGMAPGAPAGSYALTGFENVNLFNGHLNFHLPLLQVGGRGSAGYIINLNLERQWRTRKTPPPIVIYPETGPWGGLEVGYSPGVLLGRVVGAPTGGSCEENEGWRDSLTRLTFVGADGTEYELIDKLTMGVPQQTYYNADCSIGYNFVRGKVFVTHDGSGVTFNSDEDILDAYGFAIDEIRPSGDLLLKDGTRYRIDGGVVTSIIDRNGNKVTIGNVGRTITDSLNRVVTVAYGFDSNPNIDYDQISFNGTGGASRTIRIWRSDLINVLRSGFSIQTWQQLFPEMNGSTSNQFNPPVVSSVELPDGRRYWFKYNPYGELARVELPTGGAIEYDYAAGLRSGAASGSYGGGGQFTTKQIYRRVVERRIYKDSSAVYESKMTISRPENSVTETDGYVVVEQRDYAGVLLASDKHYFHGTAVVPTYQTPLDYSPWQDGRELKTESLSLTGSVLRAVEHTWANPGANPQITQSVTTLSDTNQVAKQTFLYDQYNNQTDVYEYAYGAGVSGALVRRTHTDYVTTNIVSGVTYNYDTDLAIHLRSLPKQTSVYNASGVERARTTFEYDNYTATANHAALVPRASISGLDAAFTAAKMTRGNATATTSYLLNSSGGVTGSITNYAHYDIAGNVVKTIDGRGNATTISYDDCFGAPDGNAILNTAPLELSSVSQISYAFATTVTNAAGHTVKAQFDYYLGRPVDGQDANGIVASGYYSDALDRPTQIRRAVGTGTQNQTTFSYDDTNRIVTTTSDLNSNNDNLLVSKVFYDNLGRTTETRQYEGGTNYIAVQTQYDALGRAFKTSNPFRPWQSETAVWTTTAFDALGRVKSVTAPDNASVKTEYSGNRVLVADQNTSDDLRRKRISETDGLGRLKTVWEVTAADQYTEDVSFPNWPSVTKGYKTTYQYDTLDNLTQVSQGSQPARTFAYDSLKRLTSANNPESGTISYQYDDNGNLLVKTDARGVSSHFEYDALNRASRRWYNGSSLLTAMTHNSPVLPAGVGASDEVKYFYDAETLPGGAPTAPEFSRGYATGRLVAVTYASGSNGDYYGYDAAGRIKPKIQRTGGVNYKVDPVYNLAGAMTMMTYPSGRAITNTFDSAGRLSSFSGNLGDGGSPRTYANDFQYTALNGLQQEKFGTTTPIYHKQRFNSRGQLWDMRASTVSFATDPANGDRGAIVNYYSNNFVQGGSGSDNNGSLLRQENYIPGSSFFQDTFTYDSLNRLTSIAEKLNGTGTDSFKQVYVYDRWGNRTIDQVNTTANVSKPNFGVNTANNRLTAPAGYTMSYDAAGNLTTDTYTGEGTRTYDAENKMKQAWANGQWQTYTYDGDGRRIKRNVNGTETWQVYGLGGELLAEYPVNGAAATPQKEYGYRNGELLVTAETSSGGGGSSAQPVTWTNAVGVSVSGNNLTKTATESWGNAGASSTQSIASGDGYVETTISETNKYRMIGLSNGDSHQNYNDIDFAFYPAIGASLQVYEGGVSRGTFGTYATGDVLRVAVEGGVVKYRKNGTLIYTSTVTPTYPLLVDTAFYSASATITNAVISTGSAGGGGSSPQNASFTNTVGVSASGNNLTKTAADGWGNAGASSTQSIASGDGYVETTISGTNKYRMIGLSNGDSHQNFDDIDFALYPAIGGMLYVFEGGVSRGTFGSYATGDTLRVAVEGGVVKYRKNGTLLYTSTVSPTYPLLVDTSFYSNGATLNNVVISGAAGGGGGSSTQIRWLVADQLGTPRMIFDQTGSLANVSRHDYLPFGEELYAGTGGRTSGMGYTAGDNVRQKFTGYERDNESGLDYAQARYYAHAQGRFTSVDPLAASASLSNPQTFNRYSYVNNSPLTTIDPSGMFGICPGGGQQGMYVGGDLPEDEQQPQEQPAAQQQSSSPPQQASGESGLQARIRTNWVGSQVQTISAQYNPFTPPSPQGTRVPGSASGVPAVYNCMAFGLGRTDSWIQAGRNGLGGPVIEKNINAQTDRVVNPAYFTNSQLPTVYGGRLLSPGQTCGQGTYQMRVFEDSGDRTNWHVMRRESNGTWSSKNGQWFQFTNISSANGFYRIYYPPRGTVTTTDYCMPRVPQRP